MSSMKIENDQEIIKNNTDNILIIDHISKKCLKQNKKELETSQKYNIADVGQDEVVVKIDTMKELKLTETTQSKSCLKGYFSSTLSSFPNFSSLVVI